MTNKLKYRPEQGGFTIIELMVTVAIAAITLSIAVPSFKRQIEQSRFTNVANEFLGAMSYARSEAIRLERPVAVIPRTGASWDNGWMVFVNPPRNGIQGASTVLRQSDPITTATVTATHPMVIFDSNGRRWTAAGTPFVRITAFKTGAEADLARTVCVAQSGRSSIVKGAFAC